jgi:5-methylcytosine-specific restriction endonuclease McrA
MTHDGEPKPCEGGSDGENGHKCELCGRCVGSVTLHHLYPRSQGRRRNIKAAALPTAWLCSACHRQMHTLFTNKELARGFASIEALQAEPRVQKFVAWISKQDPNKRVKIRR